MISVDLFAENRPLLFGLAYRMLGSIMDAEDVVQETYLRSQQADEQRIEHPKAYLTTILTRLCLDQLRSARQRREEYIGSWLPEPLPTPALLDPSASYGDDTLAMAFLLLLERLTPTERAVFLLHEVFSFSYEEIAPMIQKSPAACRQLGSRARKNLQRGRQRFTVTPDEQMALLRQFIGACTSGNLESLIALLSEQSTLWSDGGGKVVAALNPIYGASSIARFIFGIMSKVPPNMEVGVLSLNGAPSLVFKTAGVISHVLLIEGSAEQINELHLVSNPDKLRHLTGTIAGETNYTSLDTFLKRVGAETV